MVLIDMIADVGKKTLGKSALMDACYFFIQQDNKSLEKISDKEMGEIDAFALKGYRGESINEKKLKNIAFNTGKIGIGYNNNIYQLLGLFLLNNDKYKEELVNFSKTSSFNDKYLIKKIAPDLFSEIMGNYTTDKLIEKVLLNIDVDRDETLKELNTYVSNVSLETKDLILINDVVLCLQKFSLGGKKGIDVVLDVFKRFNNSIKPLTNRRKNKTTFEITDEYDVQDICRTVFKSIFNKILDEDPASKMAGTSTEIDTYIPSERILIEYKMIKESNNNEKEIIKQIKDDIISYTKYTHPFDDLVFFIWDPYNKTTDTNVYKDLCGLQQIQGKHFVVHIIHGR